ncbi:uncharacterized protein LOC129792765 [Lutzomyia longipalpis]|uniref:uncharacterized protein LOC129792765 n=1 Tax=Lutzomyia longipalpis TaxID=7200 RepID=UPI002483AA38|nr:uncharacterized protein LOC129792765 [Lutzomyia longipalpis]
MATGEETFREEEDSGYNPGNESTVTMTTPTAYRPRLTAVEMEALIPAFDPGQKNGLLAVEWLRKVDDARMLFDMDAQQSLVAAVFRLKGAAKDWYEGNQGAIRSYAEFKKELLLNFPEKLSSAQIHHELRMRKRKKEESVEEYFHSVVKQARRINLRDDDIREYIIEGIPNVMVKGLLLSAPAGNLPDFLSYMKKVDKIVTNNREESSPSSSKSSSEDGKCHPVKMVNKKKETEDSSSEASQGEETHEVNVAKDKKEGETKTGAQKSGKRRCFACGSEDHLVKQCPRKE